MDALRNRMEFFASMGCCVSDHALEYVMYKPYTTEEIEKIFAKRFAGETITVDEMNKFKTAFMVSVGKEYNKLNWVMQLHYGTIRDNNTLRYNQLGPDTGYDWINTNDCSAEMAQFLNALNITDELLSVQYLDVSRILRLSARFSRVQHGGSMTIRSA